MSSQEVAQPGYGGLDPRTEREFKCDVCDRRCTVGTDGRIEYGHLPGCEHRPAHFPDGGKQL